LHVHTWQARSDRHYAIPEGAPKCQLCSSERSTASGASGDGFWVRWARAFSPGSGFPGVGRGGQGRPEAARRGSLEGLGSVGQETGMRAPSGVLGQRRCRGVHLRPGGVSRIGLLQVPSVGGGIAEWIGCRPFLRRAGAAWSVAAAARRVQSIPRPRRCGGHGIGGTRAVAASDPAQPAFPARQRISPSRNP
jgi:hypothetical protein